MMKKILAAAIVSAFAAPAFAATANIDISGKMAMDITKVGGVANDSIRINDNNSSFTFAAKEDLGGGLKAGFSSTWGMNATQTSSAPTGQQQFVYLGGGFGEVRVGTHDNLVKGIRNTVDLFKDQTGDARSMINHGSIDARLPNVAAYVSPNFSGLNVALARGVDENAAVKKDVDMATATYSNGPLYAGLGYYVANDAIAVGTDTKGYRLGLGYTMGDLKMVALYQNIDNVSAANDDRKTWGLGAGYKMGAMTFKGQYYSVNDNGVNQDAKMYVVGVDYGFSKRTTAQLAYSKHKNDSGVSYGDGAGYGGTDPIGATAGQDPSRLSIGLVHSF